MKSKYKTVYSKGKKQVIINKSKFIGYAMPICDEEDAIKFINEIKTIHRDATHNIYAYVIGENNNIQRYSDDGEPSGTAGVPALEVIKKEDLRNVVVVVTRYFGGIKLGAGGLIRAYTKGAKIGLESAKIVDKILHKKLKIRIDYTIYGKLKNDILNAGYIIDDNIFDDKVNMIVYSKIDSINNFKNIIEDVSSGTAKIEYLNEEYLTFEDNNRV